MYCLHAFVVWGKQTEPPLPSRITAPLPRVLRVHPPARCFVGGVDERIDQMNRADPPDQTMRGNTLSEPVDCTLKDRSLSQITRHVIFYNLLKNHIDISGNFISALPQLNSTNFSQSICPLGLQKISVNCLENRLISMEYSFMN